MSEQDASTEVTETTEVTGGEEDMNKKAAAVEPTKGRKRKDTTETKPREKKTPLKVKAPKGVDNKETKYVTTLSKDEKRMWIRGSNVGLTHKTTGLKGFKQISADEAKQKHLGKTRMLGKVNSQEELDDVIAKFFG